MRGDTGGRENTLSSATEGTGIGDMMGKDFFSELDAANHAALLKPNS